MIRGLKGNLLPESEADFKKLSNEGGARFPFCCNCGTMFHQVDSNLPMNPGEVFSRGGWKETQISGFCEACFDNLLDDEGEHEWKKEEEARLNG